MAEEAAEMAGKYNNNDVSSDSTAKSDSMTEGGSDVNETGAGLDSENEDETASDISTREHSSKGE